MSEKASTGDIHAYVDNCSSREERQKFEALLGEDIELRHKVELWQAQSEAIRVAFGAPVRSPRPPSFGRPANANDAHRMAADSGARRGVRPEIASVAGSAANPTPPRSPGPAMRSARRLTLTALCLAGGLVLFPLGGPRDYREALIEAGVAAYRAYASGATPKLDVAASDPARLLKGLGPRFEAFDLVSRLPALGWKLRGARLTPGLEGGAAFALIENDRGGRVGLIIEPLEAPPSTPAWIEKRSSLETAALTTGGYGLAVIGNPSDTVDDIARVDAPAAP